MNNPKEQPRLSMKVLDTKIAALQAEVDVLRDLIATRAGLEPPVETGSTGLITLEQLPMDAIQKELSDRFGSRLRARA